MCIDKFLNSKQTEPRPTLLATIEYIPKLWQQLCSVGRCRQVTTQYTVRFNVSGHRRAQKSLYHEYRQAFLQTRTADTFEADMTPPSDTPLAVHGSLAPKEGGIFRPCTDTATFNNHTELILRTLMLIANLRTFNKKFT